MRKRVMAGALAASVMLVAGSAAAEDKEFANPGVINLGAETGLNFAYTNTSPPTGDSTNNILFSISPSIAYFVAEGISVGALVEFDYLKPKNGDAQTTIGLGPRVGYNLWLQPGKLSLWPQVGILYSSKSVSFSTGMTSVSATQTEIAAQAFVPLLIHPVKHFHIGVGPYISLDLSSKVSANGNSADADKITQFGILADIAAWL